MPQQGFLYKPPLLIEFDFQPMVSILVYAKPPSVPLSARDSFSKHPIANNLG
jgi:hypothetical protein